MIDSQVLSDGTVWILASETQQNGTVHHRLLSLKEDGTPQIQQTVARTIMHDGQLARFNPTALSVANNGTVAVTGTAGNDYGDLGVAVITYDPQHILATRRFESGY